MSVRIVLPVALTALCAVLLFKPPDFGVAAADQGNSPASVLPDTNGDLGQPRRHFRVRDGAQLEDADAAAMYDRVAAEMAAGYALEDGNTARSYQSWERFNTSPYTSSTHGKRYVNNYGNALAREYGAYEKAAALPQGAILAKDSFTVTKTGHPVPGPLFIMEKMSPGFSYVSGDWRYSMIMPDGSLFGTTNAEGSERVEFCISCHLARESTDHLFFIPEQYRKIAK